MNGAALAAEAAAKIVPAYQRGGALAFVYGEGSVVNGFTTESDLDLVLVWDLDEPPPPLHRPVHIVNEGAAAVEQYHQPGFWLDRCWVDGQQVDIHHVPRPLLEGWIDDVLAGGGWEHHAYPLPLYALAGFAYGVLLHDERGEGADAYARLSPFPAALTDRSHRLLSEQLAGYLDDLSACIRRGDGWLFHELLCAGLKLIFVTWFAAHHRYCPHHKWLRRWIERLGLDPAMADLERQLWDSSSDLGRRQEVFTTLARRALQTSQPA